MKTYVQDEREKLGFETWTSTKKSGKNIGRMKKKLPNDDGKENMPPAAVMLASDTSCARILKTVQASLKDKCAKVRKSGIMRRSKGEGAVVITESKYRVLLSLKEKALAMEAETTNNGVGESRNMVDGLLKSKDTVAHVEKEEETQKKILHSPTHVMKAIQSDNDKETVCANDNEKDGRAELENHILSKPGEAGGIEEAQLLRQKKKGKNAFIANEVGNPTSDRHSPCMAKNKRSYVGGYSVKRRIEMGSEEAEPENELSQDLLHSLRGSHGHSQAPSRKEHLPRKSAMHGVLAKRGIAQETSNSKERRPSSRELVFPFEKAKNDVDIEVLGASSTDEDENLEDGRGSRRERTERPPLSESEARARRKRRKNEEDVAIHKKEARGYKPFYIMVNGIGCPYGDGLGAWRAEVNKLLRALDPFVRDIRQQPHQRTELLKRRLTDKFDYSGVISDKFLIPLLDQRVSIRRNELMNAIRAGRDRPPGVDKDVWTRLECICRSKNFEKKSAAMRHANACRLNVGRTGPGGEVGVRASLKEGLQRSPDREEVQAEMQRDKGYGRKKKIKQTVGDYEILDLRRERSSAPALLKGSGSSDTLMCRDVIDEGEPSGGKIGEKESTDASLEQMHVLKKILDGILELKEKAQGNGSDRPSVQAEAAVQSLAEAMEGCEG